jgi:hypothetical protein
MADERTADDSTRDDAKCACKGGPAAVRKSAAQHRTPNPGSKPEPAVPTGRKLDLANVTAVPADSPAASIKNGAEALAAHRRYLEAQAAGGSSSGGVGDAPGPELSVTNRGTGGGLSQALRPYDASRCQLQGRGLGRLGGAKK